MKQTIRQFALSLGIDDVGFAAVADYNSPRSPKIETISPDIKSIIVLVYKELSSCASADKDIAMSGRQALYDFARTTNYRVARYLESQYHANTFPVPPAQPFAMLKETGGAVGQVSLRHAAKAAGLGVFGRHNLIIHPRFGTRVLFSAVLTDLDLLSDPPLTDELCNDCNLCVEECPARALDEEGKTDVNKCFRTCQPYGLGGNIAFWKNVLAASPEEQKRMMGSVEYWRLYQSILVGNQYYCFNCLSVCPIGTET
ncbi:MAG: epoxyqueuosine reductase [Syntrophomonadaceae bacterium]|nr:epoxyqueuosine reductase [Syntrophomonadaceae bacterium]